MVPALKPVILAGKFPFPEPAAAFELDVVGFCEVLQQIPFSVTVAPPSEVTFPPEVAVVCPMDVAVVVDARVGTTTGGASVVNDISVP